MTSRLLVYKIEGQTPASTVQMPSGSIVQRVHEFSMMALTISSGTYTDTGTELSSSFRPSITPKFADSKLMLIVSCDMKMAGTNKGCVIKVKRDDVLLDIGPSNSNAFLFCYRHDVGSGDNHHFVMSRNAELNANSTNTTTFKFFGTRFDNSGEAAFAIWSPLAVDILEVRP